MRLLERLTRRIERPAASLHRLDGVAVKTRMDSAQDYAGLILPTSCFVLEVLLQLTNGRNLTHRDVDGHAPARSRSPLECLVGTRFLQSGATDQ